MKASLWDPVKIDRLAAPGEAQLCSERDELNSRRRKRYWQGRYGQLLDYLPRVEREMLELHARGCPQRQIAALYGVSRQAVAKNLAIAIERMRWLAGWPGVGLHRADVETQLRGRYPGRIVALLWTLLQTTSQSEAARACGYSQRTASRRVHAALVTLRSDPQKRRIYLALRAVMERPGVLRKRPESTEPFQCQAAQV